MAPHLLLVLCLAVFSVGAAAQQPRVSLRGAAGAAAATPGWVLALQKCDSNSAWTLHGLWPPGEERCQGPSFDEGAISDLESTMKVEWLSCPGYSSNNLEFWTHEWTTHGTCSGMGEHDFFSAALALHDRYASLCGDGEGDDDHQCRLSCDGAKGPCSAQ